MKKTILSIALLISAICYQNLSAQKIGVVNFQNILKLLPEYEVARTNLQTYEATLEETEIYFAGELQKLYTEYQEMASKTGVNKTLLENKASKIQNAQQELEFLQKSNQDSLSIKWNDLLKPINDKVTAVVNTVAKEKGYAHVLDNTYNILVFTDEKDNIDEAVKAKLGIKDKPPVTGGTTKPEGK